MTTADVFILILTAANTVTIMYLLSTRPNQVVIENLIREAVEKDRYIELFTGHYEDKSACDPDYPNYPLACGYHDSESPDEYNPFKRKVMRKIPINPDLIMKLIEACGISVCYEPEIVTTRPEKCELIIKEKHNASE